MKNKEINALDYMDQLYELEDNKEDLDFWEPLSQIILECVTTRSDINLTQKELAEKMGTKQSVISRFENMGRIPSYKFLAKLAHALGRSMGMTLNGKFMAVVPVKYRGFVSSLAKRKKKSTSRMAFQLLKEGIEAKKSQLESKPMPILPSSVDCNVTFHDFTKPEDKVPFAASAAENY